MRLIVLALLDSSTARCGLPLRTTILWFPPGSALQTMGRSGPASRAWQEEWLTIPGASVRNPQ